MVDATEMNVDAIAQRFRRARTPIGPVLSVAAGGDDARPECGGRREDTVAVVVDAP
jgi:hypothetical protein